ncbi:MAG TPA: RsmG family class I SAM-dependent methyltransferase [Acidimicrobiia bacterium]|nr:RsmG family class I SAM-dependent methyltransferase [Acidimicrobiia bacterium]
MARHIDHGRALLAGLPERGRVLDLGSGGGLPGLVLAICRPDVDLTLLEARQRACRFLREAVADLGVAGVAVIEARAEDAARRPDLRETFDAVVARSFGPPAVTAECAVGFLRPGAALVVSEPPGDEAWELHQPPPRQTRAARWPAAGLAELGFGPPVAGGGEEASFVVLEKTRSDDRWPRRVGVPAKRPLWTA